MKFALAALLGWLALSAAAGPLDEVPVREHQVLRRLARDPSLFTQGLLIHQGLLYHSAGNYDASRLLYRGLEEPGVQRQRQLPGAWFAEGIAILGDELFLLTWREQVAAVYRPKTLLPLRQLHYQGQGWGLTSDGQALIMSDGSAELLWRDPADFSIRRRLRVLAGNHPVARLNELEWVDGLIYANVWQSDQVVAIDAESGQVRYRLDLAGLLNGRERRRADVLNGIAFDCRTDSFYVTGKYWPWLFELRLGTEP